MHFELLFSSSSASRLKQLVNTRRCRFALFFLFFFSFLLVRLHKHKTRNRIAHNRIDATTKQIHNDDTFFDNV